jgi:hypothetical protein
MAKSTVTEAAVVASEEPRTIESVNLDGLNISGKIRALSAAGFSNGQIAKYLDKRYQHVRNVLITPVKNPVGATQSVPAAAE